jgi:hypothetical protein
MNKRLFIGAIVLLGSIPFILAVYDQNLKKAENIKDPVYLSSYPDTGYLKIDSEMIITSLAQGNNDVFKPLLEDPSSVQSLKNVSFAWTQADILRIVGSLGQFIWNDPMSLEEWRIYEFYLQKSCQNDPTGFDFSHITYFKLIDVNGTRMYTTRHIEIDPYYTTVRWGSGANYPQPILWKWTSFNLADSKISAEMALQIAEQHGGKEARLKANNECLIIINNSSSNDKWLVKYVSTDFSAFINTYTGQYEILNPSK